MNKKGFTLIEILAVIVIIGITATIGIAAVSRNITKSRDSSVVDLAKNYAEGARTMKAKDNFYYEPKNGEAIIIPYSGIEGVDIENGEETAYGAIIPSYCFIGIANNGGNFYYYINQVDESYHIINGVEYNSLDQDDIISGAENLVESGVKELKAPYNSFSVKYGDSTYTIKGVRVRYTTKFETVGLTSFDAKTARGKLKIESNKVTLTIDGSEHLPLPKGTYTFTTQTTGTGYQKVWKSTSDTKSIGIKAQSNDEVVFDILINDKVFLGDIKSTSTEYLSGYYTKDATFASSNANHKGNITLFDTYKQTGKFSNAQGNVITYNENRYVVKEAEVLYVVVKK